MPRNAKRRCKRCKCTGERGCQIPLSDDRTIACCWVAPDLCSGCATMREVLASPVGRSWLCMAALLLSAELRGN